jgi:hypothetical protein
MKFISLSSWLAYASSMIKVAFVSINDSPVSNSFKLITAILLKINLAKKKKNNYIKKCKKID